MCHSKPQERCHSDVIIEEFNALCPSAFDWFSDSVPPTSTIMNYLARLREELPSDEGFGPKERLRLAWAVRLARSATDKHQFHQAGDQCHRGGIFRAPTGPRWSIVSHRFFAHLVQPDSSLFDLDAVADLKKDITEDLKRVDLELSCDPLDRSDIPIDYRFLGLLLRAADDPEVGMGVFCRRPRLPALYRPKKK